MMGKNETSKAPKAKILTKNKKLGGKKENISIIKIKKTLEIIITLPTFKSSFKSFFINKY